MTEKEKHILKYLNDAIYIDLKNEAPADILNCLVMLATTAGAHFKLETLAINKMVAAVAYLHDESMKVKT